MGRGSCLDLPLEHGGPDETNRGSTEEILRGPSRREVRGSGFWQEGKDPLSGRTSGFVRQVQTQHRLPRSYYQQERIYKIASTGDLVTKPGELGGERRSQRFPASR